MAHHPQTNLIRIQSEKSGFREHSVPIYMSSSFTFDSGEQMAAVFAGEEEGKVYSRYDNPNSQELIKKMCALEGAESGVALASGMAAVFASVAGLLKSGDHLIACRSVFGSTHQLLIKILPKMGITCTYVDGHDPEAWTSSVKTNTKMLLLESPSNPGLSIIDLRKTAAFCKENGLIMNVDNCFATPIIQQPILLGADIVTHSATKYIDGQGRSLGGLILGRNDLIEEIDFFCKHTGPSMSPFNAWLLSKSLETMYLRVNQHCENAFTIAKKLQDHPDILQLKYPFLKSHPQFEIATRQMTLGGGIFTISLKGGPQRAIRFINSLQLCSITANLGDSRSIVTHPASSTHSKLTEEERQDVQITPELIRFSVGLEYADDILEDILQAINKSN